MSCYCGEPDDVSPDWGAGRVKQRPSKTMQAYYDYKEPIMADPSESEIVAAKQMAELAIHRTVAQGGLARELGDKLIEELWEMAREEIVRVVREQEAATVGGFA